MAHHSPLFLSIAAVAILAELLWRLRTGRGYDGRAALTTAGLVAGNLVAGAVHAIVLATAFGFVWTHVPQRFFTDQWYSWVLGFFAVEFAYYWFHRASHEIRWLWASHNVHHSAEQLTFLSSLRLGWTNTLSLGWLFYLPVIAIGFDPRIIVVLLMINLNYQFFLHSEAIPRLGMLEWIFNTPHHHRAHHASNPEFLDRNYGGILIIWDRLFNTIAPECDVTKRYGLVGKAREDNPFRVALREWKQIIADFRNARDWKARWASLVRIP